MATTFEATSPPDPSSPNDADDVGTAPGIGPRTLLAALSLAAGAIHLVMIPAHAGESTLDAVLFAATGWLQILLALGLLLRPSRAVLQATVVLNVALLVAYVISRTAGLPFGAHPGIAEPFAAVDVTTAIFEGLLVLGAVALMVKTDLFANLSRDALVVASVLPVAVLVAASVALADPSTAEHGHSHSDSSSTAVALDLTSITGNRCDLGFNPASYWRETTLAQVDTIYGGAGAPAAASTSSGDTASDGHAGHTHGATAAPTASPTTTLPIQGSPELDKLIAKATAGGEANDAGTVVALASVDDNTYDNFLRWLPTNGAAHTHTTGAPDDNHGMGGHLGPQPWRAMTNQTECDQLQRELQVARDTALKYPHASDAVAAGYVKVTPYVPGIAAHYMKFSYVDGTFEIDKPEMVLFDGNGDDASVVGLSYFILHDGTTEPTQGFAGREDHYHRHDGLCIKGAMVIGDSTTTAEQCAAQGGVKSMGGAGWMSHAWVVPGCESPWGVFSGATPVLDKALGENSGKDGGHCQGSGVRARYDFTPGSVSNTPTTVGGQVELASGG